MTKPANTLVAQLPIDTAMESLQMEIRLCQW